MIPTIFRSRPHSRVVAFAVLSLGLVAPSMRAQTKTVSTVPYVVQHANNLGAIAPDQDMRLTVWLHMRNEAEFNKLLADIYTPGSPSFHKWMTASDLQKYAPAASDRKLVVDQLTRLGLSVTNVDDTFSIRVHGPASTVQNAFKTRINSFEMNGRRFHANISEAELEGAAGNLVLSVGGLSSYGPHPFTSHTMNPKTGHVTPPTPIAKVKAASGGLSSFFTTNCFSAPSTHTFGPRGGLPTGVFFGPSYVPTGLSCGYLPAQVQSIYDLKPAYAAGISGTGQTIVIVDAYGSPSILNDANTFNSLTGLPALTSSNFKVIYPDGMPLDPSLGPQLGWDVETSLDVEWAHAIAPAAKIVLLVAAAQDDEDFQAAIEYAAVNHLGSVISNSYGGAEVAYGPAALDAYDLVIKLGAAAGISVNFSSGDGGDEGLGTPTGAASAPADSPYGTAVGGTSFSIPNGMGGGGETGWGNNQTLIAFDTADVADPPINFGTVGGGGGGSSIFFSKPAWQGAVSGTARQVPDVAALADPYTGAVFVYTDATLGQVAESIGGTSLACPIFSGFWALANQKAGHLLGQAAPIIAALAGTSALHDIVPINSPSNVVGTVIDTSGATFYSAAALAAPLEGTTQFVSAIWPIDGEFVDLTFGTDSSLQTAPGWDDVTGFGSPVGYTFILAAAKH